MEEDNSDNNGEDQSEEAEKVLNERLLQVTVKDRTILYSLAEPGNPKELMIFDATRQFISVEDYVQTGFGIIQAYEDPTEIRDGWLLDKIIYNLS